MNALLKPIGEPATMTSREIAELTGKEHKHVMRDIRAMLVELGLPESGYVQNWTDPQNGQTYQEFALNRELTDTLLTGYSITARNRVIKRWHQLEAGAAPALNMRDPKQMAMAALQLIEVNQELQATIEQQQTQIGVMAPKVEALERIALADGSLCIRDAAKTLQVQERAFKKLLVEKEWVYTRPMGAGVLAYSDKLKSGLMEHKITKGEKGDGSEWVGTQARVTPKGLTKLAEVVRQAGLH